MNELSKVIYLNLDKRKYLIPSWQDKNVSYITCNVIYYNWFNLVILSLVIVSIGCAGTKKEEISANKLLVMANSDMQKKKYGGAQRNFERLLEEYPDSVHRVDALLGLADSIYKQKRYEEARFQLVMANSDMQKKKYEKAQRNFERLLEEYPDSVQRVDALLGLADSIYKQKRYEEARFQYQKFTELNPMHSDVDRAHFYIGMCSFKEIRSFDRDQVNTHMALEKFEKLMSDYPNSQYYYKASIENIKFCRKRLAENLFYIGRFYFRIGAYQATVNRMQELLSKYPDQEFVDQAIYYLGESYLREGSLEKAKKSFQTLISDYPQSKYVGYAKKIVTVKME